MSQSYAALLNHSLVGKKNVALGTIYGYYPMFPLSGEMAEWFKAHAWKVCGCESASGVRIPVSPQFIKGYHVKTRIGS